MDIRDMARQAKEAALGMAALNGEVKNQALAEISRRAQSPAGSDHGR